jgi:ribosomal-protein-alanine N-acetyltransferase
VAPCIETHRLMLRPLAPADWDVVHAMLSDAANTEHMHFSRWTDLKRREWFEWCLANDKQANADAINWAITLKRNGRVIGWFGIGASDDGPIGERSFGYLLDRAWWNQGYMTEALGGVLAFEFGTLDTARIHATSETANPASARVMEKVGMRRVQTVLDADFEGNLAERDHYAIGKQEYAQFIAHNASVLDQAVDSSPPMQVADPNVNSDLGHTSP